MRDELKISGTAIVWGSTMLIMLLSGIFARDAFLWIGIVMGVAALGSTLAVWLGSSDASRADKRAAEAEKFKRPGRERISRLIDEMSDAELQDFGAALEDYDARRERR